MPVYEYKVVPAPRRGEKARDAKTTAERFAYALTRLMNEFGRDGWDYLRADTLPCEERSGLTGKTTAFQNMLVFRREVAAPAADAPLVLAAPAPQLSPYARQGVAPRLTTVAEESPAAPGLGPARSDDLASG